MSLIICHAMPSYRSATSESGPKLEFGEQDGRLEDLKDRSVFSQRAANPDHTIVFLVPAPVDLLRSLAEAEPSAVEAGMQDWDDVLNFLTALKQKHPKRLHLIYDWEFDTFTGQIKDLMATLRGGQAASVKASERGPDGSGLVRHLREGLVIEGLPPSRDWLRACGRVAGFFSSVVAIEAGTLGSQLDELNRMSQAVAEVEELKANLASFSKLKESNRILDRRVRKADKLVEKLQAQVSAAGAGKETLKNALAAKTEALDSISPTDGGLNAANQALAKAQKQLGQLEGQVHLRDERLKRLMVDRDLLVSAVGELRKTSDWIVPPAVEKILSEGGASSAAEASNAD